LGLWCLELRLVEGNWVIGKRFFQRLATFERIVVTNSNEVIGMTYVFIAIIIILMILPWEFISRKNRKKVNP